MYYNTTRIQYKAAPTTANNSALAYNNNARPIASLPDSCIQEIKSLETSIFQKTGQKIALIAYRL